MFGSKVFRHIYILSKGALSVSLSLSPVVFILFSEIHLFSSFGGVNEELWYIKPLLKEYNSLCVCARACVCVCACESAHLCVPKVSFYTYPVFTLHWKTTWKALLVPLHLRHFIYEELLAEIHTFKMQYRTHVHKEPVRMLKQSGSTRTKPIYMKKSEHHNQLLPLVLLWSFVLLT